MTNFGIVRLARWKFLSVASAPLRFQAVIAVAGFADTPASTQNTHLVGQCFTVQGRLSVHANRRPYLWPIGTDRLLGIAGPDGAIIMPPEIARIFASPPFDRQLVANFEVCPFARPRPGTMQMVCIAAARNLKIRKAE